MGEAIFTSARVLEALKWHVGKAYGVSAAVLARQVTGAATTAGAERALRECIVELRLDGHHICGHPATGYYLAATPQELDETCRFLVDRCMTGLTQVSRMKKVSLPDLYQQLRIPT